MLEDSEFLDDKACPLRPENRIPGSVTRFLSVIHAQLADYKLAKGVFGIQLDEARDVTSSRQPIAAPGGLNFSIVLKTWEAERNSV